MGNASPCDGLRSHMFVNSSSMFHVGNDIHVDINRHYCTHHRYASEIGGDIGTTNDNRKQQKLSMPHFAIDILAQAHKKNQEVDV